MENDLQEVNEVKVPVALETQTKPNKTRKKKGEQLANNHVKKEDGASPYLTPAKSNLLVIGLGGCGAHSLLEIFRQLDPEKNKYLGALCVESNRRVLSSFTESSEGQDYGYLSKWIECKDRFRTIQIGDKGLGAGGDIDEGERMAKAKIEQISSFLEEFDNVIIVGGGGGGTCGAMAIIAEILKKLGVPTYALLTMPTLAEGPRKAAKSRIVRDKVLEICPLAIIDNEHVPNKKLSLKEIQREINETSLFWVLSLLRSMLQEYGDGQDLDGSDWKTATSVGNYTLPGFFDASKGLEGFEKGLLGNPYLNPNIIKKAQVIDFWFEGYWPYDEIETLTGFIRSKIDKVIQEEKLEIKWGVRELGVPEGTKTVGFVAFAKEGPDEPDERQNIVALRQSADEVMEPTYSMHGEIIQGNTNGSLDLSTTRNVTNHGNSERKISFSGIVNGEKIWSEASESLVLSFKKLFLETPTRALYESGEEIQRRLKEETGLEFEVPKNKLFGTVNATK